jgi:hypothetical protein
MATENLSSARSVARSPEPVEGTVGGNGLTEVAVGTVVAVLREDVAACAPEFAGNSLAPRSRVAGESETAILRVAPEFNSHILNVINFLYKLGQTLHYLNLKILIHTIH